MLWCNVCWTSRCLQHRSKLILQFWDEHIKSSRVPETLSLMITNYEGKHFKFLINVWCKMCTTRICCLWRMYNLLYAINFSPNLLCQYSFTVSITLTLFNCFFIRSIQRTFSSMGCFLYIYVWDEVECKRHTYRYSSAVYRWSF